MWIEEAKIRPGPSKQDSKKRLKNAINSNPNFKSFLEDNNCYGRFIKNVLRQNRVNVVLAAVQNHDTKYGIIDAGMNWSSTAEGHEFWKNIAHKALKQYS